VKFKKGEKMFKEKFLSFYHKINPTSFNQFFEVLSYMFDLSRFNCLQTGFGVGRRELLKIVFVILYVLLLIVSASCAVFGHLDDFGELSTALICLNGVIQITLKKIELLVHRHDHREMMQTVKDNTEAMRNDPQYRQIEALMIKKVKRALTLTSMMYIGSFAFVFLFSLYQYLAQENFFLLINIEIPGTNKKTFYGWLINFITSLLLGIHINTFLLSE